MPTPANSGLISGASHSATGGEAFDDMQLVYKSATDKKWYKALSSLNLSSSLVATAVGVAISTCSGDGGNFTVCEEVGAEIKGITVANSDHILPDPSGDPANAVTDITVGHYINWFGYGNGTNWILSPQLTGLTR